MSNIGDLKFDDKNFNKHTEYGMSLLEKSLRQNGAGRSILIDKDNNIIAGNGIIEAAGNIGLEDLQIVETDGTKIVAVKRTDIALDSEEGRTMALADNATASADLEWDAENIEEVSEKFDLDPGEWISDWNKDEDAEIIEDETPEVDESEPAKSVLGGVYQLGRHRLMCGDSTDAGSVAILMDGQKADMVFTDPPYGMDLDTDYSKMPGTNTHYTKVIGDDKEFDMKPIFESIQSPIWYIWGADYLYKTIPHFDEGNYIVWSKRMSDEENAVFGSAYELVWTYPRRKKEVWFVRGINQQSERLGEHPTQKPVELGVRALRQNKGATNIVDLFGGSGSTLIACEQLDRKCYMMELDPHYCDVIRKRYWKFTHDGNEEGWEEGTPAI